MEGSKKKKKKIYQSKKLNKYRTLSLVLTSSLVIAPLTVPLSFYLPGGITASAAILDAEILSNINSSNNSSTTTDARWTADGTSKNVDFSISGSELVGGSTIKNGKKQAVLTIPKQLNGRVTTNGPATIDTNITLTVSQLTFLSGTLQAVNTFSETLAGIVKNTIGNATGVNLNLTNVYQKIDALNNLENFGSATVNSTPVLSADGTYISANIDDGLGVVLAQNVQTILKDLKTAIDQLNATGSNIIVVPLVNSALAAAKIPIDAALNLSIPLLDAGGAGVNQLADASVLGSTTINIPTKVVSPTSLTQNLDARFVGTVVKADAINVSLINTANGISDIYYAGTPVIVAPPKVTTTTGTSATGYTVIGTATAGDTITIKNASGTTLASGPATGGSFSINIPKGSASANEELTAIASNGGNNSVPTTFTTPEDTVIVAPPTLTSTTGNSTEGYTVNGTAVDGSTVSIKNANGTTIASGLTTGGNFSINIPKGSASASEDLIAIATKEGIDSSPIAFKTPADPVVITAPVVSSVTGDSAAGYTVKGTSAPSTIITVKNTGGTVIGTAIADSTGDFTVMLLPGSATPEEALTAIASDILGNNSDPTSFKTPSDVVAISAPTVSNVTGTSSTGYAITGKATAGNNVVIKNAGGIIIASGLADPSGNYTANIPIGVVTPNEALIAIAVSGINQSKATSFTIPADPVIVSAPIVSGITGNASTGYTVTGTATPGDTITIKNTGGTALATGTVSPLGQFSVNIPAGSATPLESLNAIASDTLGNQSPATPFMTPPDASIVIPPTVTSVTGSSSTGYIVKGTATAGNLVSIKNTGGTVIASASTDIEGNYTVVISAGLATPNEQMKAVASDSLENQSIATNFTTPSDPVVVKSPVVSTVKGTSATGYTIIGTATPGDSILIKNTGGTVIGSGTANTSGNFTIKIPTNLAKPSEQLFAIADDGDGNQSSATPFITPADPEVVTAPTVTSVSGSSSTGYTVKGTATPGDTVSVKNTGGTVIGSAIADSNGNFTVIIPIGLATPNQQLTVTAQNSNGNTSAGTNFTTPADPVTIAAPIVTGITGTSTTGYTVTGTATPGHNVMIKNTGGTVIGTTTVNSNGNFSVMMPIGSATSNEALVAIDVDGVGNQSPATPFMTPADPVVVNAPVITSVTGTSTEGYTVTGTATSGNTVSVKNTGGNELASAVSNSDGDFTITIPQGSATPVEQLKAVALDEQGNQSPATPFMTPADPVIIAAPVVTTVTGTSSTGYTVTGTAVAGNTISIKKLNGTEIGTAKVDDSGKFTIMLPTGTVLPLEQLKAIAYNESGNQSPATLFVTPADPEFVAAPAITSVTGDSTTGYTVIGTANAGNSISLKDLSGTEVGAGTVDENGDFTIELDAQVVEPLQQLNALAINKADQSSLPTLFTIPADPSTSIEAPIISNVTGTSKTGYVVTGKATIGNKVQIRNASGRILGSTVTTSNEGFSRRVAPIVLDGNFSVTLPPGSATENEVLTATVENNFGDVSTATTFKTPADPTVFVTTPIIESVIGNSLTGYTIKGIATPGNDVVIQNSAGKLLGKASVDAAGGFKIEIPIGFAEPKELVSAIAIDKDDNQSEPANFNLPTDPNTGKDTGNTLDNIDGSGGTSGNKSSSGLKNLSSSQKDLPNNGETINNWGVIGMLLLGILGFFTFKRTNKKEE